MTRERPGFLLVHDCLSHKDFEAQSAYSGAECCGITSFCFGTLRENSGQAVLDLQPDA